MKKKKNSQEAFDYARFERQAINRLRAGKGLIGEEGALTGLIGRLLHIAYEEEITNHIDDSEETNRRNGYTSKTVKTSLGDVKVSPPRDRNGSFDPIVIGKRQRTLAPEIERQILGLYGRGSSYSDISAFISETYGVKYSHATISELTDLIYEEIMSWKSRALEAMYAVIYLDAIHYKIREDRKVKTMAVYTVYGVDLEGNRDVLAIEIGAAEGSRHWARMLEHLKDRGIEDVLFFCIDGLKGFSQVIQDVFPQSHVQRCIVHMIRNSCRYVSYNDRRAICKDLRKIYTMDDAASGYEQLQELRKNWPKYAVVADLWEDNWIDLSSFFDYSGQLRKMIYTTNPVEALHRCMRKVTKTKGAFVNQKALEKQLYLALKYSKKSWKKKVQGWPAILTTLSREFPERIKPYI